MNLIEKLLKKGKKTNQKLSREQVLYQINEVKFCMNYCALESVAVSILSLLLFIGAPSVFPEIINPYLPSSLKIMQGIVIVPTVFWLLTIINYVVSWFKVRKLSKLL